MLEKQVWAIHEIFLVWIVPTLQASRKYELQKFKNVT